MYRITREVTELGVCFTLLDPNDGYVAMRYLYGNKGAFMAPQSLRMLQSKLNTQLVLDCGGAR